MIHPVSCDNHIDRENVKEGSFPHDLKYNAAKVRVRGASTLMASVVPSFPGIICRFVLIKIWFSTAVLPAPKVVLGVTSARGFNMRLAPISIW